MKKLLLAAALAAGTLSPALAAKIDFTTPITQIDGKTPMKIEDKVFTLGDAAETALLAAFPDEQSLDGKEKNKRFWLARNIHQNPKTLELTTDDVTLIKTLVAKAYNPLVTGQVWSVLDPATIPK